MALGISQALRLPVASAYSLARVVTLIASVAVLFTAFQLITPSPLQLALLTLPMSLFQLASTALDGFSTSVAVLALTLQALPEAQPRNRAILYLCLVFSILLIAGPLPSLASANPSLCLSTQPQDTLGVVYRHDLPNGSAQLDGPYESIHRRSAARQPTLMQSTQQFSVCPIPVS